MAPCRPPRATVAGDKAFAAGADIKEMAAVGYAEAYNTSMLNGWETLRRRAGRAGVRVMGKRAGGTSERGSGGEAGQAYPRLRGSASGSRMRCGADNLRAVLPTGCLRPRPGCRACQPSNSVPLYAGPLAPAACASRSLPR